ncbi:hypothetical protein BOX15_Mlig009552g1 [Macrostomum lignano]|uniref:Uncharacterized protein n=1 Tax=Macrostomum lignano TaxID=282301 RepID=A0A267DGC3_9PLAT|nr:hypothetical protein BOX15_Mlig009552g1 [Macrostomum lignano]
MGARDHAPLPKTPFILVGTQCDLRNDQTVQEKLAKNKQRCIAPEQGEKLARELKAVKYVECSALTQKNLKAVFDEAIMAAWTRRRRPSRSRSASSSELPSYRWQSRIGDADKVCHSKTGWVFLCNTNLFQFPQVQQVAD